MTDTTPLDAAPAGKPTKSILVEDERTRARNRAEARFRAYGIAAIAIAATFLVILLATIVVRGVPAFTQTYMTLDVTLEANALDPNGTGDRDEIAKVTTF